MRISLNTSKSADSAKWWQNIWAALIFFTRLPFWRIYLPPKDSYKTVVEHWPLVGWLTGTSMACVLCLGSIVMPYNIAVIAAIITRIMITGALHEDGLTDFIDGFGGGGSDRQRILDIMKDSRIGTYGVLGIIFYLLLLFFSLSSIPPALAALTIFAADPYSKMIAGQIVQMLPYARTEEQSKAKNIYRKISVWAGFSLAVQGLLPLAAFIYLTHGVIEWEIVVFAPCIVMYVLYMMMAKKLRGYTGDCCGALFLLIELSVVLTVCFLWWSCLKSVATNGTDLNDILLNHIFQ